MEESIAEHVGEASYTEIRLKLSQEPGSRDSKYELGGANAAMLESLSGSFRAHNAIANSLLSILLLLFLFLLSVDVIARIDDRKHETPKTVPYDPRLPVRTMGPEGPIAPPCFEGQATLCSPGPVSENVPPLVTKTDLKLFTSAQLAILQLSSQTKNTLGQISAAAASADYTISLLSTLAYETDLGRLESYSRYLDAEAVRRITLEQVRIRRILDKIGRHCRDPFISTEAENSILERELSTDSFTSLSEALGKTQLRIRRWLSKTYGSDSNFSKSVQRKVNNFLVATEKFNGSLSVLEYHDMSALSGCIGVDSIGIRPTEVRPNEQPPREPSPEGGFPDEPPHNGSPPGEVPPDWNLPSEPPNQDNPPTEPSSDSNLQGEPPTQGNPLGEPPTEGDPSREPPSQGNPLGEPPTEGDPSREPPTEGDPPGEPPPEGSPTAEPPPERDPSGNTPNAAVTESGRAGRLTKENRDWESGAKNAVDSILKELENPARVSGVSIANPSPGGDGFVANICDADGSCRRGEPFIPEFSDESGVDRGDIDINGIDDVDLNPPGGSAPGTRPPGEYQ